MQIAFRSEEYENYEICATFLFAYIWPRNRAAWPGRVAGAGGAGVGKQKPIEAKGESHES